MFNRNNERLINIKLKEVLPAAAIALLLLTGCGDDKQKSTEIVDNSINKTTATPSLTVSEILVRNIITKNFSNGLVVMAKDYRSMGSSDYICDVIISGPDGINLPYTFEYDQPTKEYNAELTHIALVPTPFTQPAVTKDPNEPPFWKETNHVSFITKSHNYTTVGTGTNRQVIQYRNPTRVITGNEVFSVNCDSVNGVTVN